jgi:hypothetical protein
MGAGTRFAALLAVLVTIGAAGAAWGSDGDPLILGQQNKSKSETILNGALGLDFLQFRVAAGSWVYADKGLTVQHSGSIGRLTIGTGQRCALGPQPPSDPADDQSTPMIFTSIVGFPHGTYVVGSQVTAKGLKVCLNRSARSTVRVNWVSIDMDTLN